MCVRIPFVGIILFNFVITAQCALKTFRYDNDILNPENWVDKRSQEQCEGLIFPEKTYVPFLVEKLEVDSLVLLETGEIIFTQDAAIEFSATSKLNCVELKLPHPHFWAGPSSWSTAGKEDNSAIPHLERLPCEHDDVNFPHGDRSGLILHFGDSVKVKSFTFGNESWTSEDLKSHSESFSDDLIFVTMDDLQNTIHITNKGCGDESGCLCGNERAYFDTCNMVTDEEHFRCNDPVIPIGFCQPICGAGLLIVPPKNFKLAEMEDRLQQYSSQTYVSKVKNDTGYVFVQIIFTEEKFTGNSLDDAYHLYEQMKQEFLPSHVTLYASGEYNNIDEEYKDNAVSIVFGTLLGVALVFIIIFLVYSPNGTAILLRNRLNLGTRHLPNFRTAYFTRHSSVAEDEGLIFEGQSMGGSLLSLNKSFDNPMYGKDDVSTASTSCPSNNTTNQDAADSSKNEDEIGKFMRDEENKDIDYTSEGELVDLSDM